MRLQRVRLPELWEALNLDRKQIPVIGVECRKKTKAAHGGARPGFLPEAWGLLAETLEHHGD
jgi:hypothetical protein